MTIDDPFSSVVNPANGGVTIVTNSDGAVSYSWDGAGTNPDLSANPLRQNRIVDDVEDENLRDLVQQLWDAALFSEPSAYAVVNTILAAGWVPSEELSQTKAALKEAERRIDELESEIAGVARG